MRRNVLFYSLMHLAGAILLFGVLLLFALSKFPLFFPVSELIGLGVVLVLFGIGHCLWQFFSGIVSFITGK